MSILSTRVGPEEADDGHGPRTGRDGRSFLFCDANSKFTVIAGGGEVAKLTSRSTC